MGNLSKMTFLSLEVFQRCLFMSSKTYQKMSFCQRPTYLPDIPTCFFLLHNVCVCVGEGGSDGLFFQLILQPSFNRVLMKFSFIEMP